MKTNILFACLILMLSAYDACAATNEPSWCPCCPRRTRTLQPQQDITPQIPVTALAPASQAATATTDPQTPAPTPEELAAQKSAAGASTIDSWVGEGWSNWLPSAALKGIGGLSLTAQQQREAAVEKIGASTAQFTHQLTLQGEQIVESVIGNKDRAKK